MAMSMYFTSMPDSSTLETEILIKVWTLTQLLPSRCEDIVEFRSWVIHCDNQTLTECKHQLFNQFWSPLTNLEKYDFNNSI